MAPTGDGGEAIQVYEVVSSPGSNLATSTAFGLDGRVTTDVDFYDEWIYDIAVDNSGRIVAVGSSDTGTSYEFLAA